MAQKFPNPEAIDFLVSEFSRNRDEEIKEMITLTLDRMEAGGIHDNISGGFFRYSTRPDWSSPHYEKMLESERGACEELCIGLSGPRQRQLQEGPRRDDRLYHE